jgi:predicted DNA-binding antitoxin AbrB/MazE fold protein
MEKLEIEAVYEHGTLKLPRELPLQEGEKVTITIHPTGSAVKRLTGLLQWKGSQEDLDYLLGPDNHPWANEE